MKYCKCPICGSAHIVQTPAGLKKLELTEDDDVPEITCPYCRKESRELAWLFLWRPWIKAVFGFIIGIVLLYAMGFVYRALSGN
jgi:hypothetical protein